jgi:hypothetical protein
MREIETARCHSRHAAKVRALAGRQKIPWRRDATQAQKACKYSSGQASVVDYNEAWILQEHWRRA